MSIEFSRKASAEYRNAYLRVAGFDLNERQIYSFDPGEYKMSGFFGIKLDAAFSVDYSETGAVRFIRIDLQPLLLRRGIDLL